MIDKSEAIFTNDKPTAADKAFAKISNFYSLFELSAHVGELFEIGVVKDDINGELFDAYLSGVNPVVADRIAELCFEEAVRLATSKPSEGAWKEADVIVEGETLEQAKAAVSGSTVLQKELSKAVLAVQLFLVYQALKAAAKTVRENPRDPSTDARPADATIN